MCHVEESNACCFALTVGVFQAEKNIAEMQTRQAEQKAKLDRLRGNTGSSDTEKSSDSK